VKASKAIIRKRMPETELGDLVSISIYDKQGARERGYHMKVSELEQEKDSLQE